MGPQNSRNQNMQGKKNEEKKQIKKPDISNVKFGKKRKKKKGLDLTAKLPNGKNVFNKVTPNSKCLLRLRKFERVKDYLLMEEDYIKSQSKYKTEDEKIEEEKMTIELLRGSPITIGTLEEIINEDYAIVSVGSGEYYVKILSIVDKEQLELGCSVLLRNDCIYIII